jgi:hypothetical protein
MKLLALVDLTVPEGSFAAGTEFETRFDVALRVVAKGHARPVEEAASAEPIAAAPEAVEARDPAPEHRDPAPVKPRRRR